MSELYFCDPLGLETGVHTFNIVLDVLLKTLPLHDSGVLHRKSVTQVGKDCGCTADAA